MEEKLKQHPSNCIKIVLFGPESTGKTTLSKQLAEHYNTKWVPEFSREYLQKKWDETQKICEPKDIMPIAIGQMNLENHLAQTAKKVLFCDTNLMETKVYSEVYFNGYCEPLLDKYAKLNTYHLYFLTYIDTPWEPDDLRDRPNDRLALFNTFENALKIYNKPYIILRGTEIERFKFATTQIDNLLKSLS